jgi:hypothetical protein
MRLAARLLLVASALIGWHAPVVAGAGDSSPGPGPTMGASGSSPGAGPAGETPILWLRGPFGTVPSGDDARLDAYVRSAPLRLETGDPDVSVGEWRASFHHLDGESPPLEASGTGDGAAAAGGASLTAPDVPGTYRLDTTATLSDGSDAAAAWTVVVPDRPLPADGLIDVPAPDLLLTAASGTVAGWAGSGCYIYLCVDVGRLPPLRTVTHIDVAEGEELTLRLSDDSAIAAWKVTLYPIVSGVQVAMDDVGDEPDVPVASFDVQAPVAGEWLIQAEVTYDRMRGWRHAFYRLTSHGPEQVAGSPVATATR